MPTKVLLEAIALHKCIRATYNRQSAIMAPHILYTKHGELHLDAVTVERDGKPPREPKVGTYKLTGLSEVELVDRPFTPESIFDANDPKYAGVTLFAVEPAA
ncbi:hypothetical protein [Sphingomonas sp. C3-2]|uniref:hypothetical protein n=1 Tax=Sphingomonas sp. C3-2 TaxID=3062169 RepID=UPI00294B1952|nr:hypothetical protein [Sphingomonas sp. C3-2]WOK38178.1 hypothetical protein QYC26_08410 [Sphingomonas sp. C3-2]